MGYTTEEIMYAKMGYGDNWERGLKNLYAGRAKAKEEFLAKYPKADVDKFKFEADTNANGDVIDTSVWYKVSDKRSFDITSDTFLNNKKWTHYLNPNAWPVLWSYGGTVPEFTHLTGSTKAYTMLGYTYHETKYQKFGHLGQELHNFDVYVAPGKCFKSNFPKVTARWSSGKIIGTDIYDSREEPFDYKKDSYYAMLAGMYIASYLSGISMQNLKDNSAPDVIKSIARFHLYYQTRKFMTNPALIDKYDVSKARTMIPYRHKEYPLNEANTKVAKHDSFKRFPVLDGTKIKATIELTDHDYYGMIAYTSNGLTAIGLELLQESCEAFVYSVLGAQAKTRWTIINNGGRSLQTQTAFMRIVEDTILQSDTTVTLSNMRQAIEDCNVTLNMAITPGVILIPSSMIILQNPIAGYNNTLTLATGSMSFGLNNRLNYSPRNESPKTKPFTPEETTHSTLPNKTISKGHKDKPTPRPRPKPTDNHEPPLASNDTSDVSTFEMIAALVTVGAMTFLGFKYFLGKKK